METNLHLISAPWAALMSPSIQIGALKAYLDSCQIPKLKTECHSAFLQLPLQILGGSEFYLWSKLEVLEEAPYALALISSYFPEEFAKSKTSLKELVEIINAKSSDPEFLLTEKMIHQISTESKNYVKESILRESSTNGLDVYGFTLNYNQVMSSLFIAKAILELSANPNVLFLFGGMSASVPSTVNVIHEMNLPAFGVLGEGEGKLELIARTCTENENYQSILQKLPQIKGVYSLQTPPNLWIKDRSDYENQRRDLATLPIPDYSEFFETINSISEDPETQLFFKENIKLPIEGSRGCFAKCTFCGLNYMWEGFRKIPSPEVLKRVEAYRRAYDLRYLQFMDNVCDTWAEFYADSMIQSQAPVPSFMELRAHHPETFWTKLSLSGVSQVQIGVEALSEGILKLIAKGTTVAQNLLAMKHLQELGVESFSNLISHYPGSTPEQVEETKQLLMSIPHFHKLTVIQFRMVLGSPLFERMSYEQRKELNKATTYPFPENFSRFDLAFGYETPKNLLSVESLRAWEQFEAWVQNTYLNDEAFQNARLTCHKMPEGQVKILDSRDIQVTKEITLQGPRALVFQLCHAGPVAATLLRQTGLSTQELNEILEELLSLKLLHLSGQRYINLALRPREELIHNLNALKSSTEWNEASLDSESGPGLQSTLN